MQLTIDFAHVQNLFEPVPDGMYQVRITAITEGTDSGKGPWCKVDLMICEGEFAETRQLTDNWMFMDSALWRTKPKMEAFAKQELDDPEFNFDSDEWIGLEAMVITAQEPYTLKNPKPGGPTEGIKSGVVEYHPMSDSPVAASV